MRGIQVEPSSHRSGTLPEAMAAVIFSSPLCQVSCSMRTSNSGCSCSKRSRIGSTTSAGQNCQNTISFFAFEPPQPASANDTPKIISAMRAILISPPGRRARNRRPPRVSVRPPHACTTDAA